MALLTPYPQSRPPVGGHPDLSKFDRNSARTLDSKVDAKIERNGFRLTSPNYEIDGKTFGVAASINRGSKTIIVAPYTNSPNVSLKLGEQLGEFEQIQVLKVNATRLLRDRGADLNNFTLILSNAVVIDPELSTIEKITPKHSEYRTESSLMGTLPEGQPPRESPYSFSHSSITVNGDTFKIALYAKFEDALGNYPISVAAAFLAPESKVGVAGRKISDMKSAGWTESEIEKATALMELTIDEMKGSRRYTMFPEIHGSLTIVADSLNHTVATVPVEEAIVKRGVVVNP